MTCESVPNVSGDITHPNIHFVLPRHSYSLVIIVGASYTFDLNGELIDPTQTEKSDPVAISWPTE
eukprot:CAMPEP_0185785486 /NCGR_PEP_ID=MMETSP1174-20130828/129910_1 /TAXON_ID=35687 /ORGANISM="Dictyocha speculum, Strain CCMP1381" /LENGTH=64 /DNA_ID=CAMNT_0028477585 /DNA_START=179 /DNA_END=373 /DNA_ORIENTATION=+